MNIPNSPSPATSGTPFVTESVVNASTPKKRGLPAYEPFLIALVLGASLVLSFFADAYFLQLIGKVLIFWSIGLGLQTLTSHAGVISLGHAAFLALGAYIAGAMTLFWHSNVVFILAAVIIATGAAGLLMGALVLRTQGLYQLMATLAIAQMMYYGFQSLRSLGGDDGFAIPARPPIIDGLLSLDSDVALSLFIVFITALVVWLMGHLNRSELGALMRATRDDEQRVASLGESPYRVKLVAFFISAVLAGIGGALIAYLTEFASPKLGDWMVSGELVILVLLGGASTRIGIFAAALAVVLIQEQVAQYTDHWPIALGLVVLLRVLMPGKQGGINR